MLSWMEDHADVGLESKESWVVPQVWGGIFLKKVKGMIYKYYISFDS